MTNFPVTLNRCLDSYKNLLNKFPPDGQKQTSRYFEVDCRQVHILNKLRCNKNHNNIFTTRDEKHVKKMLLTSLDLADRKVDISKRLMDIVDNNILDLKMNLKNIETACVVKPTLSKKSKKILKRTPYHKEINSNSDDVLYEDDYNQHLNGNKTKLNKNNVQIMSNSDNNIQTPETVFTDLKQNVNTTNTNENPRTKYSKSSNQIVAENSNNDINEEPTYCICEQISYGTMVCCDNDLCPIQWFHFGCVSLNKKPRGIWYCPRCRGPNSKTMKSRKIFFKELEEYNRRKEEGY